MSKHTVSVFIHNCDFELIVTGDYTSGSDGRTYGPPEDCYPGYPSEFDIEHCNIMMSKTESFDLTRLPEAFFGPKVVEEISNACLEKIEESWFEEEYEQDREPQDYDWLCDTNREPETWFDKER